MAIAVNMNTVKTYATWLIILGFLSFAGWQAFLYIKNLQYQRITVAIKDTTYDVRVAASDSTRQKGLSGTKELAKNDGMLFVFDRDDTWGIWMKDMVIPIDILWLDKDQKVIYIVKQADPSSYPYTTYKPTKPARYVIELPAGAIEGKALKIGDTAAFDNSQIRGVQ